MSFWYTIYSTNHSEVCYIFINWLIRPGRVSHFRSSPLKMVSIFYDFSLGPHRVANSLSLSELSTQSATTAARQRAKNVVRKSI